MKEYFVIYDKDYHIIAYCDNLEEVSTFCNRRLKQLKYKFKSNNCVQIQDKNLLIVWKFC